MFYSSEEFYVELILRFQIEYVADESDPIKGVNS